MQGRVLSQCCPLGVTAGATFTSSIVFQAAATPWSRSGHDSASLCLKFLGSQKLGFPSSRVAGRNGDLTGIWTGGCSLLPFSACSAPLASVGQGERMPRIHPPAQGNAGITNVAEQAGECVGLIMLLIPSSATYLNLSLSPIHTDVGRPFLRL